MRRFRRLATVALVFGIIVAGPACGGHRSSPAPRLVDRFDDLELVITKPCLAPGEPTAVHLEGDIRDAAGDIALYLDMASAKGAWSREWQLSYFGRGGREMAAARRFPLPTGGIDPMPALMGDAKLRLRIPKAARPGRYRVVWHLHRSGPSETVSSAEAVEFDVRRHCGV